MVFECGGMNESRANGFRKSNFVRYRIYNIHHREQVDFDVSPCMNSEWDIIYIRE